MRTVSLLRKLFMALTGLFLSFFLIIHLLGNFQLFLEPAVAQEQFNYYSDLLSGNIIIKVVSFVLYFSIIGHIICALIISIHNRKVAGQYKVDRRGRASAWESRNMGFLGTILFVFLVIHFADFWYVYKFGEIGIDPFGKKDLYTVVVTTFSNIFYVIIYVISMLALGLHLRHGVHSAMRTLGVFNPNYVKGLRVVGLVYTYAITLGFVAIPLFVFFKQL